MRMIFMGSDAIALPGLRAISKGECGAIEIVAIYTQPDRPKGRGKKIVPNAIKLWALEEGIEVRQPEKMTRAEREWIEQQTVDSVLVMAYGHMLSQKLIDTPRLGTWNLHTSILPSYRGASPIQCAVVSGDPETGVSLMKLVREMDAGPVLDVERVSIERTDTALDVEAKLSAACVPLLVRGLPEIHSAAASPKPQDAAQASFVRKLTKEDGELDFRRSAEEVARRINGLFPWPGTRAHLGELTLRLGGADWEGASPEEGPAAPGAILGLSDRGLRVACGDGVVLLTQLQRPGGKMLAAAEFMRGCALRSGDVFRSEVHTELVSRGHV